VLPGWLQSGLTPLHVSAFMGHMNIAMFLLQSGANPNYQTARGETPLHLATRANQTDIIRVLLRHGAHVDAKARVPYTSTGCCQRREDLSFRAKAKDSCHWLLCTVGKVTG